MKTFRSYSSEETKRFGESLGRFLKAETKKTRKGAAVFALQGNLGAGKTTFTQGFFKGLGIKRRPSSPTFVIMKRFGNVYHIDAYRFKKDTPLDVFGFKEIFADPKNIVFIEWPEKMRKILPKGVAWLKFEYGEKENERKIIMRG